MSGDKPWHGNKKNSQAEWHKNLWSTFCSWRQKPTWTQNITSSNKPCPLQAINRVSSRVNVLGTAWKGSEKRCFLPLLVLMKNKGYFSFTISTLHNVVTTLISSEESHCSYHLEFIFQVFPAVIILQLWQFNWDWMAAHSVNKVHQAYSLERKKNAPDISLDSDVLLKF